MEYFLIVIGVYTVILFVLYYVVEYYSSETFFMRVDHRLFTIFEYHRRWNKSNEQPTLIKIDQSSYCQLSWLLNEAGRYTYC